RPGHGRRPRPRRRAVHRRGEGHRRVRWKDPPPGPHSPRNVSVSPPSPPPSGPPSGRCPRLSPLPLKVDDHGIEHGSPTDSLPSLRNLRRLSTLCPCPIRVADRQGARGGRAHGRFLCTSETGSLLPLLTPRCRTFRIEENNSLPRPHQGQAVPGSTSDAYRPR